MLGIPKTPCQNLLGFHDRIHMHGTPSQRLPRRRQPHCTHATKPLTAWLPGRLGWLGWLAWLAGLAWLDLAPPRGEELLRIGMNDKVTSRILQELLRTTKNPYELYEVFRILKNLYESLKSSQLCSDAFLGRPRDASALRVSFYRSPPTPYRGGCPLGSGSSTKYPRSQMSQNPKSYETVWNTAGSSRSGLGPRSIPTES